MSDQDYDESEGQGDEEEDGEEAEQGGEDENNEGAENGDNEDKVDTDCVNHSLFLTRRICKAYSSARIKASAVE